jgi:hypothetical protein
MTSFFEFSLLYSNNIFKIIKEKFFKLYNFYIDVPNMLQFLQQNKLEQKKNQQSKKKTTQQKILKSENKINGYNHRQKPFIKFDKWTHFKLQSDS